MARRRAAAGAVAPRWQTPLPPTVVSSWGPDVVQWARDELHVELDPWQQRALNRALATDATGRLVHQRYLISTARQNGKTVAVRSLIGWALTAAWTPEWTQLVGLAHEKRQARYVYDPVLDDLAPIKRRYPRGGLALTRYLGIRSDLYGRHREYSIGSRDSRNALRGGSFDLVLFDELRTQTNYDTWNAVSPTTTARPDPLIVGLSTAGGDNSVLLRDWFDRGLRIIAGDEPMAGFGMTWYAAGDDDDPRDPAAWRKANPALATGRLREAPIREDLFGLTPAGFRSERLNLWSEGVDDSPVPAQLWRRQVGRMPDDSERVVIAAEAVPSWRRVTVSVAIATEIGAWVAVAAELDTDRRPKDRPGGPTVEPRELVDLVDAMARAWRPSAIAFSKAAAAAPHLEAWAAASRERTGLEVEALALGPRQLRQASELFRSELMGGRLTHLDDPLLAQQARVARASGPIAAGDWYLSTRHSLGDVDAIRAACWAAFGAIAPEEAATPPQVFLPRPQQTR